MSPIADAIAEEYAGRLKVVKANVEEAPQAAGRFGVTSIPNFMLIKGGEVKLQLTGARPKAGLVDAVTQHLS